MSWCALDILAAAPERSSIAAWLVQRTGQSVVEQDDGSLLGVASATLAEVVLQELIPGDEQCGEDRDCAHVKSSGRLAGRTGLAAEMRARSP